MTLTQLGQLSNRVQHPGGRLTVDGRHNLKFPLMKGLFYSPKIIGLAEGELEGGDIWCIRTGNFLKPLAEEPILGN